MSSVMTRERGGWYYTFTIGHWPKPYGWKGGPLLNSFDDAKLPAFEVYRPIVHMCLKL